MVWTTTYDTKTLNSNDVKYATITADDLGARISNLVSTCGVTFDEAAESVVKLQESLKTLSERVVANEGWQTNLHDQVTSAVSTIDCSTSRIYELEMAIENLKEQVEDLQSQLRPGTVERTVRPKQKSDLEIFCRDVLNMELPNFDKYFTLIDFS